MEMMGYRNPLYEGYEEPEETLEKMMRAIYGDLDREEMEDLKARREERMRIEREKMARIAQGLLRKAGRPVRRADMLTAMDLAISQRVRIFQTKQDIRNAIMLLATIICKNILTDGPLHEEG